MINRVLELELRWGNAFYAWGVVTASFICEGQPECDDCEFRFACYTTSDVVIELEHRFTDYHNAKRYRDNLRKRFPKSRLFD